MIRKTLGGALMAGAALLLAASPALAAGAVVTNASGPDYTYGTNNPFTDARVEIHGVQTANGTTSVTLEVSGIDPAYAGHTFGAHVHVNACGADAAAAGGHYHDTTSTSSALEDHEIWLDFTVTKGGTGHARAERPWTFTSSAQSVVIHAAETNPGTGVAGARLACTNALFHS